MYSTSWNALIALDNTKGTVTDVVSCILLVFCVKKTPKHYLPLKGIIMEVDHSKAVQKCSILVVKEN